MRRERLFKFKKFEVNHSRSAHKVGVDGVLIGAWANIKDSKKILDVGTGCGLIALMCAQRNENSTIYAIDIDEDSLKEAENNFHTSPWGDRLFAYLLSFTGVNILKKEIGEKVDHIISNPPYFYSGVSNPDSKRLLSRHSGELSPISLLKLSPHLLNKNGMLSMIFPYAYLDDMIEQGKKNNMIATRICNVKGNYENEYKRSMVEFCYLPDSIIQNEPQPIIDTLTIEESQGCFTNDYINLCKEFYLKF